MASIALGASDFHAGIGLICATPPRQDPSPAPRQGELQSRDVEDGIAPAAAAAPTTSCSRSFSDLDPWCFALATGTLCALRTAVQQPLNLALVRKQCCPVAARLSTFGVISRIAVLEGGCVAGLSQGMAALVIANALSETIYMVGFEFFREHLPIHSDAAREATSGYMGDAVSRSIHIPLLCVANRQMTRMRFQPTPAGVAPHQHHLHCSTASGQRLGIAQTIRAIYGENGLRSLYSGLGTSLSIGCFWTGAWWAAYDACKVALYGGLNTALDRLESPPGPAVPSPSSSSSSSASLSLLPAWTIDRNDNFLINAVASVVASAATAVVFNPFLVIRTRLMTTPNGRLLPVAAAAMKQGGLRTFWVGTWLNVTTSVVDGYLASTSYEMARLWSDTTKKPSCNSWLG